MARLLRNDSNAVDAVEISLKTPAKGVYCPFHSITDHTTGYHF